jgi:hypothetical protein
VKRGGAILALAVAALLALFAYWSTAPTSAIGIAEAELVGAAANQGKYGGKPLRLTARLESGLIASFTLPKDAPLRPRERVRLQVRRQEWWPYNVSYRFVSYVDEPDHRR